MRLFICLFVVCLYGVNLPASTTSPDKVAEINKAGLQIEVFASHKGALFTVLQHGHELADKLTKTELELELPSEVYQVVEKALAEEEARTISAIRSRS